MSSPIVAFVSIFLSLTMGVHPVEVLVSDEVERVELWLDHKLVGDMRAPAWSLSANFGRDLEPHLLEAVAFNAADEELARIEQWVNLPKATAEADLVIERTPSGRAHVRLTWANVMGEDPVDVELAMDGRPLEFEDPTRIPLPEHDVSQLHFLRAELHFEHNVSVVEEVTFGGSYGDELNTELTALPILPAGDTKKVRLPEIEALQDWFLSGDRPVVVAAVEEGPAEITIIRDRAVQGDIERLVAGNAMRFTGGSGMSRSFFAGRFDAPLKDEQKLAFFWPFMVRAPAGVWTFPAPLGWMSPRDGGVGWFLATVPPPAPPDGRQLLTDAVAVAGMNSLTRNRRRAVVLILGRDPADSSRLSPETVRSYLRSVRVPLYVWSPYEQPHSHWGEVRDISNMGKLRSAVSELARDVERQRIIWFEGRHLPQRIGLSDRATNVAFPE